MEIGTVLHVALAAGAGWAGYAYGIKRGDRELALMCASAQPSIAIAMSLFDLGVTFSDMEGALASGGIFKAMSLKMFHMVAGIGLGVAQETATHWMMPVAVEERKSAERMKSVVTDGIAAQVSALNQQVARVGQAISAVPAEVHKVNQQAVQAHSAQSEMDRQAYNGMLNGYAQQVFQAVDQTRSQLNTNTQQIQQAAAAATATMKQELNDTSTAFGDKLRQEAQQVATTAAHQGGQVIIGVAQQVATTLQATTATSLQAAANLAKVTSDAQSAAQSLRPPIRTP